MSTERERVICVSLSEQEWKAFVARHPQPVDWLRQQILAQLDDDVRPPESGRNTTPAR